MNIAYVYWKIPHPRRAMCAESIGADFYQIQPGRFHPYSEMGNSLKIAHTIARKKKKYDYVLVDTGVALVAGYILKKILRYKTKIIFYCAEPFFDKMGRRSFKSRLFKDNLISCVDAYLTPSEFVREQVLQFEKKKPVVIAPGFLWRDDTEFHRVTPDLKKRNLIFIGNAREEKGLPQLLEAFDLLRSTFPKLELYIVGRHTKERIAEQERMHVMGEMNPTHVFPKCAFLIQPSLFDSAPITVYEAMAAGVLPIVSKTCGNYPTVAAIDKRLVLAENTADDIYETVLYYMGKTTAQMKALSTKAKKLSKQFNKESGLEAFKRAFREVVGLLK